MADISKTNTKILKKTYKDMLSRYQEYKKKHSDNFKVFTKRNLKGDYIYRNVFEKMVARFNNYKTSHQGKDPDFVYVVKPKSTTTSTGTVTTNGWTLTGTYRQDFQDTSYTCGPSSTQMVFSALGRTVYEATIAKLAGTNHSGTTHEGLESAIHKIDSTLKIKEYGFNGFGITAAAAKLLGNCEFIVHLRTGTLKKDAYGKQLWTNDYGHYIFLVGVNPTKGLWKIADPTKGIRDLTTGQLKVATAAVVGQDSLISICK